MELPESRTFWLAALVLAAALIFPFFLVDVPPVLDYPNHLARWFVLAHPDDPILSRFYAPNWHITPNLGFDSIAVFLLRLLPVHEGGRLLLAMGMFAPVAGVLIYSRAAFGRLNWWSLASGLAGFNGIFLLGFLNFLLGVGLAFGAAGVWLVLRRRGQDIVCVGFGAIASALLFLCHIFGVLLFALLIGCQEISRAWRPGSFPPPPLLLRSFLLIAAALIPAALLYLASPLSNGGVAAMGWDGSHKVWDLFIPFLTYSKVLTLMTGFAVFGILICGLRKAAFAPGTRFALVILALVYAAAPASLKGGTFVDPRLGLMIGLVLFAGIRPALTPQPEKLAILAVTVLFAVRIYSVSLVWADHGKDLADLRAAIAKVAPGARVLVALDTNPVTDAANAGRSLPDTDRIDSHLAGLLVIERRAFWPLLFADKVQQPVIVRPPYDKIAFPLGDPVAWRFLSGPPTAYSLALAPYLRHWRADFDNVLLIDRPEKLSAPPGLVPLHVGDYAVLYGIAR